MADDAGEADGPASREDEEDSYGEEDWEEEEASPDKPNAPISGSWSIGPVDLNFDRTQGDGFDRTQASIGRSGHEHEHEVLTGSASSLPNTERDGGGSAGTATSAYASAPAANSLVSDFEFEASASMSLMPMNLPPPMHTALPSAPTIVNPGHDAQLGVPSPLTQVVRRSSAPASSTPLSSSQFRASEHQIMHPYQVASITYHLTH